MRMYRMSGGEGELPSFPTEATLIVNTASPLIQKIAAVNEQNAPRAKEMAAYLYRLAVLSQRRFTAEEMQDFLRDSYQLLSELPQ